MIKKPYLVAVGLILMASLAGCTTTNNPNPSQSASRDANGENSPLADNSQADIIPTDNSAAKKTTIDLSGRELDVFPNDILSNKGAKILNLSDNNLTTLPAEIGELTNLEELYLDRNQLTGSLPAEIRKMTQLRILSASGNRLSGIPAEIGQLNNLKTVDLSNNDLDTMPNEIENLKNLKILDLSGNRYSPEMQSTIRIMLPQTQVVF